MMSFSISRQRFCKCAAFWALFISALGFVSCASPKPPLVNKFESSASILKEGEKANLSWDVSDASEILINPGIGVVSGSSVEVSPLESTIYTLVAKNSGGVTEKTVNIKVKVIPRGEYFGVKTPLDVPELFLPDAMRELSPWAEGPVFSEEGDMLYINVGNASYSSSKMYYSKRVDNVWQAFVETPFTKGYLNGSDHRLSKDKKSLIFSAVKSGINRDLFEVRYDGSSWSNPVQLKAPVNSDRDEFNMCYSDDGSAYIASARSGKMQVLKLVNNKVEALGPAINASGYDGDPCVAPDGRFLVFYTVRDGGINGSDLYVCFSDGSGGWGEPISLGPKFNSDSDEYGARLSNDGKYMFFTRHTKSKNTVYWVSVSAIDKLKP